MDSSTYYPLFRYFLGTPNITSAGNIWLSGPTEEGKIVYSVITPIICFFGIFGNGISLVVLSRKELKGSVYVYLAAFVDFCSSILLFLSGLSCGVLFFDDFLLYSFDVIVGLPLSSIFSTMCVLTTLMVALDRVSYLANPLTRKKPRICHSSVARRTVVVFFILSILINVPYFFVFKTDLSAGVILTLPLFYSNFYKDYNWCRFLILGIIPSVGLTCANGYLIHSLHELRKRNKKCLCNKQQKYTSLTATLVLIVFFFLISEIPSMLTSRTAAASFFFTSGGAANSKQLETTRQITTLLNAISLSADFVLYYLFCPPFCKALAKLFRRTKGSGVQMNVFVLDQKVCIEKKTMQDLAAEKLFEMMKEKNGRNSSSVYDGSDGSQEGDKKEFEINRDTVLTLCHA